MMRGLPGVVTLGATVLTTLLAIGLVKPFGGDEDALGAAVREVGDAGSARIDLERRIEHAGTTNVQHGTGIFDFRANVGELTIRPVGLRFLFIAPSVYARGYLNDSTWCEFDLSVLGSGLFFGAITGFSSDPSQALVNLEEHGEYEEVGDEHVFGVPTTHYRGTVDLRELQEDVEAEEQRDLLANFIAGSGPTLPLDVWITRENLIQRLRTSFRLPANQLNPSLSGTADVDLSITFSDYGARIEPSVPSPTTPAGEGGCPAAPF